MRIPFVKIHGCGNDFILIDEAKTPILDERLHSRFARHVCDRHRSIGADGVIFISRARKRGVALAARFYMPDGSESEMCGNGARCVAAYAVRKGMAFIRKTISILTIGQVVGARVTSRRGNAFTVRVSLGRPKLRPREIPVNADGDSFIDRKVSVPGMGEIEMTAVNTGVPHAVIFVDNVDRIDVEGIGRAVRQMKTIFPRGTNVNFVQFNHGLKVKTYERGVERETLSCGTGVAASAVSAYLTRRVKANKPIEIATKGGHLTARILADRDTPETVLLSGPVEISFRGEVDF